MSSRTTPTRWRRYLLLLALAVVPVLVAAPAMLAVRSPAPHHVPVAVVSPVIVADEVAREISALPGAPVDAVGLDDPDRARAWLREGRVRAVVLVDLAGTRDRLLVASSEDERLRTAVTEQARAAERSRGRTVAVEVVDVRAPSADLLRWVALAAGAAGVLLVALLSYRRGSYPRDLRAGLRRLAAVLALAVGVGVLGTVLLAAGGGGPPAGGWPVVAVGLVVAGCVLTSALLVYSLEALAGILGLALGVGTSLASAVPLVARLDPLLLPVPWGGTSGLLPPVASVQALEAAVRGYAGGLVGPAVVLLTWVVGGLLVLALTRVARTRLRRREEARARPLVLHPGWWRVRVVVVVVPLVVMALFTAVRLSGAAVPPAASVPTRDSETRCLGTGDVRSVADLNRIATSLRGGPAFQGADVGADVQLADDRRLMMFGDTLRAPAFPGQRFVRNSMLVFAPGCVQVVLPTDRGALIPDRPAERGEQPVGYWPMSLSAAQLPGYQLVAVFAQRVRTVGQGTFGFENLGPAIAVFVVRAGGTPQLLTVRDLGADSARRDRPTWGAATARSGGWLYVYGTANPHPDQDLGFSLRVARVRPLEVLDQRRWRYWDGRGWVRSAGRARELVGADGGTSQTLSVFRSGQRWFALSKRDEFLGRDITVWEAPTPWGPFDEGRPVAALPSDSATGELRYMPLAHPDLLPQPGTVVVSYSRNRTDAEQVQQDPFLYRPAFLRVRLPAPR